jgi:GNAT superfamily N-acetyltransferase
MEIMSAQTLELPALARVFDAGFSGYVVPLQMTESALAEHLDVNGIDLACSRVLADPEPVAFVLIAWRDGAAWVGGIGTAPSHRGRGLGEQTLWAGVRAAAERGCDAVWLEVIERDDEIVTAVIVRRRDRDGTVVQIAAADGAAAADALGACAAGHDELRVSNVAADDPLSPVLAARELVRQHELRLSIRMVCSFRD